MQRDICHGCSQIPVWWQLDGHAGVQKAAYTEENFIWKTIRRSMEMTFIWKSIRTRTMNCITQTSLSEASRLVNPQESDAPVPIMRASNHEGPLRPSLMQSDLEGNHEGSAGIYPVAEIQVSTDRLLSNRPTCRLRVRGRKFTSTGLRLVQVWRTSSDIYRTNCSLQSRRR